MSLLLPESAGHGEGNRVPGGSPGVSAPVDPRDALEYQAGPPGGDATRHLCAAAFLDRGFRQAAITELVEHQHRVPAASPGIDMARVLDSCLHARRESAIAGGLVLAVAFVGLLVVPADTALALSTVLFARLVTWSLGPFLTRQSIGRGLRWQSLVRRGLVVALLFMFSAGSTASIVYLALSSSAGSGGLLGSGSNSDSGSTLGAAQDSSSVRPPGVVGYLAVLGIWVAIGTALRYRRRMHLAALNQPRAAQQAGLSFPRLVHVFDRLRARPAEAETLYSDFSPFVGAGLRLEDEGWSFPIELRPDARRHADGSTAGALELPAVHRCIADGLAQLSYGELYPGDLLHRLTVRDRVFRTGRRREPPAHWYGALSTADSATGPRILHPAWADLLDYGSHERIRHYLEARAELWEDQVVASLFVRAYIQGGLLQVEGLAFLLPPVAERYRTVDDVLPPEPLPDGGAALWSALRSFARDVCTAVVDPWAVLWTYLRTASRSRWCRRMVASGRPVDYGPRVSLRELGAEPHYQQLFQEMDVRRFFSSMRERAFSAILAELKRAGYETGEFEQAVQYIFAGTMNVNSGAGIQNVNSPNSGNQSAGQGNTSRQTRTG